MIGTSNLYYHYFTFIGATLHTRIITSLFGYADIFRFDKGCKYPIALNWDYDYGPAKWAC